MKGSENWAASYVPSLMLDPATSGLPLLNVSDGDLMKKIYAENGSGWIKVGVVRDPITRLLSAYLDLVRGGGADSSWYKNDSNNDRRSRRFLHEDGQDLAKHDGGRRPRHQRKRWRHGGVGGLGNGTKGKKEAEKREPDEQVETQGEAEGEREERADETGTRTAGREDEQRGGARDSQGGRDGSADGARLDKDAEGGLRAGSDADVIPTFEELVDALETSFPKLPAAFRPMSTLCGMRPSSFDTIVPFETLQVQYECVGMHVIGGGVTVVHVAVSFGDRRLVLCTV